MSDYEALQTKRNIIVGLFALLALCALVWLVYKFEDLPIRIGGLNAYQVFIQFSTAAGVQEKTPVRFCGYQIGKVVRVRPPEMLKDLKNSQFYYQAVVVVNIENQFNNIPVDVEPKLMTRGFGSSYIEFRSRPLDVNGPRVEFLVNGTVLQGSTAAASEFFPEETQQRLEELVDKFKTFIDNANDILGDKTNKDNFKAALANLADATKQASAALKEFQQFSAAGNKTLTNAEVEMRKISSAMVGVGDELSKTSAELRAILEKINKGQGTAGKLINDGRLYESLLENSQQFDVLLEELKEFMAQLPEKGVPIKLK